MNQADTLLQLVSNDTDTLVKGTQYLKNPNKYLELFGHHWSKQKEVVESVFSNKITVVRSSNIVGKTHVAAEAAIAWFDLYRHDCKVVTTAKTFDSMKMILWARIRERYKLVSERFNDKLPDKTKFEPDREYPDWYMVGLSPKVEDGSADAMKGYHSAHTLVMVDEAITIAPEIWDAIETIMLDEGSALLIIFNPTTKLSRAVDYEQDPRAHSIVISAYDLFESPEYKAHPERFVKLISPKEVERQIGIYGIDSPQVRASILAEYPSDEEETAISYHDCVQIKQRFDEYDPEVEKDEKFQGFRIGKVDKVVFGWDVAGEGSDFNVLCKLISGDEGMLLQKIRKWHKGKGADGQSPQLSDRLYVNDVINKEKRKYENVSFYLIPDAVGEGSDIPSLFSQWQDNLTVTGFKAGEKAKTIPERKEVVLLNKISEAWYRTGLLFSDDVKNWKPVAADLDKTAIHQLSSRKRKHGVKAKEPLVWYIEPKEDWKKRNRGQSPDDADSIVMTIWGAFAARPIMAAMI